MYKHCHDSNGTLIQWPDGGCYFDQMNIVADMFSVIRSELEAMKDG